MFIDCTGFKCLLIDGALNEPFESINDTLLNDTAITCRMPYADKSKELESFTDCTALSSGWVWNTPLWSRIGTGYVFATALRLHPRNARTIALETGIQNGPLAVALVVLTFSGPEQQAILAVPVLYSLFIVITSTILTFWFRRIDARSQQDMPDSLL